MKGAYCLLLSINKNLKIEIGKLGLLNFEKGKYVYVGSAMNNIEKRVKRHLKKEKKLHWHIDYLTINPIVKIENVYYKESNNKEECKIANFISNQGVPIIKFGCTDCKCKSHLYKVDKLILNNWKEYKPL